MAAVLALDNKGKPAPFSCLGIVPTPDRALRKQSADLWQVQATPLRVQIYTTDSYSTGNFEFVICVSVKAPSGEDVCALPSSVQNKAPTSKKRAIMVVMQVSLHQTVAFMREGR